MADARCGRCGVVAPSGASFCPSCGTRIGAVVIDLDALPDDGDSEVVLSPGGRRNRRIGAGVAAALVVAVAASVAVGGDDRRASTTSTTRLGRAATTTTETTVASAASTTPPPPTTTTTVRATSTAGVPLLGEATGIELIVAAGSGMYRLELDTGVTTEVVWDGPGIYPDDLAAVRGGFVSTGNDSLKVVPFGGRVRDVSTNGGGQLLGTDGLGRAWYMTFDGTGPRPQVAVLTDARSEPVEIELPIVAASWPIGAPDWQGGFVVGAPGGVFRLVPGEDPRPVAPGTFIDTAGTFALSRVCYPDPTCRLEVTDLETGNLRSALDIDTTSMFWQPTLHLAPDGHWIVRDRRISAGPTETQPTIELRNVDDGSIVELAVPDSSATTWGGSGQSTLVWSYDGRWLFYASGNVVSAWRAGLAAPINVELPELALRGPLAVVVPE